MNEPSRALTIDGDLSTVHYVEMTGPTAHFPEVFRGQEDFYNPRIKELRQRYRIGPLLKGTSKDWKKILQLRHWIHTQWPTDQQARFSGDAFAILEKAKEGVGFHCAHSMTVQQAVLSSFGFVCRNLGVDRNPRTYGSGFHHGVNEVWSNELVKWVVVDAQYDVHFERGGVPMSALELHEAVRQDGARGVLKVKGVRRRRVEMEDKAAPEATTGNYWWVSYQVRTDPFTHPHWAGGNHMAVYDSDTFRSEIWTRERGGGKRAPHWAYDADAFIKVRDRNQIEWTPGVPEIRLSQKEEHALQVVCRSATPNLKCYRYRIDKSGWRNSDDGRFEWGLKKKKKSTLELHTRNLFGVDGPTVSASTELR
jgi:hypothetical protein